MDDLEATAYGVLGLLPSDFWDLTFREFKLMQKGYLKRLEKEQIHNWDLVRTLAVFVLQPHMKKGKTLKPKDIIPLPTDKKKAEVDTLEKRRKNAEYILKERALQKKKNKEKGSSSKPLLFNQLKK